MARVKAAIAAWRQALLATALSLVAASARAEAYALLMWIGNYAEPGAKLQGIDRDAEMARDMARRMGVPGINISVLSNAGLDFAALRATLAQLRTRLRSTDTLFIYFSGHGKRVSRVARPGCQEGLVTVEGRLYFDLLFQDELEALARVAGRVVVFNDSCHSGGMATKSFRQSADPDAFQAKAYPLEPEFGTKAGGPADDDDCARPVNAISKSFGGLRGALPTEKLFYLAASAANEAAWATPQGSLATRAWHACLTADATDTDRDGQISGSELVNCASPWIRKTAPHHAQTITALHNDRLPLARVGSR